ncbi:MAG: penicillin amidase [Cyclobacteriaceae bacterium]|jgi:penicillin amidase
MKIVRFILSVTITSILCYYLSTKMEGMPPIGKFINPYTGFWQNGQKEALELDEDIKLNGLQEEVVVKFDEQYYPHIFAKNDNDLYFTQGYVTARDRLWQMEFQLLAAAGRVSEVIGKKAIDFDRGKRRIGLLYGAKRMLEKVSQNSKSFAALQAYTNGINAYIDLLDYPDYPIEYKLLDYSPEPWENLKSCLFLKLMENDLSRYESDLENTNALKLFGREDFEFLFPERNPNLDPIIPKGTRWDFTPIEVEKPAQDYTQPFTKQTIDKPDPRNGSNSFVVSGDKTANGKVLLSNEMDLQVSLPSVWYILQLHAPGVNVFGSTMPGAPGVIAGFNDSIAWGETNAKRDVVDWYMIEFKNNRREEYKYDDKWLKTQKIVEEIKVRDGKSYYDTLIFTHYGPVTYDRNYLGDGDRINYAMKWTAHEGSDEYLTFYELNRAKNYNDFVSATDRYDGPPQNFAFASASGEIAIRINGKFPVKWDEQGKFLLDGSNSEHEWQAIIPKDQNMEVTNPIDGFVSSANQHPADNTYPYYTFDANYEYYRNRRINDRLRSLSNVYPKDMMQLQNDNYNYRALESLPVMLDSLDTTNFSDKHMQAIGRLKSWDYFNDPELLAPSIYQAWWDTFYDLMWDEFDDQDVALIKPNVYNTINMLNNFPKNKYFDRVSTSKIETANDLINESFSMAIDSLEAWKVKNGKEYVWYEYKNTSINHLLDLKPFSVETVKIGGGKNIVNAASAKHGPSWRMVVELGENSVKGWGVYPGSQTGNPGNPSYGHLIDAWAKGQYFPLVFLKSADEAHNSLIFTQNISPK